jgi:hypothetical protein
MENGDRVDTLYQWEDISSGGVIDAEQANWANGIEGFDTFIQPASIPGSAMPLNRPLPA